MRASLPPLWLRWQNALLNQLPVRFRSQGNGQRRLPGAEEFLLVFLEKLGDFLLR
jgi:hypothetical protein